MFPCVLSQQIFIVTMQVVGTHFQMGIHKEHNILLLLKYYLSKRTCNVDHVQLFIGFFLLGEICNVTLFQ